MAQPMQTIGTRSLEAKKKMVALSKYFGEKNIGRHDDGYA